MLGFILSIAVMFIIDSTYASLSCLMSLFLLAYVTY